jgi:RNA-directed DNA polymerase
MIGQIICLSTYHQSAVSSEIFNRIDSIIWNMLWHWAKRRHPEKSKHWIARKYWHRVGKRNWVFSDENRKLRYLSDTKIIRHARLKLDMNPYLDKEYFVLRKLKQKAKKLTEMADKVWDKVKKIFIPATETMTNNCCPI